MPNAALALSFAQPWMLLGLILAAIPLLIHLFYRRRYEEVQWAAVLFLSGAVKRNAQRSRFQQLLLLILRTLAIAVLVFAFAGPALNADITPTVPSQSRHIVLVLDGSLSMLCREEDGTRFERAVSLATIAVENSSDGDTFQLLMMNGETPEPIIAEPTGDKVELLQTLAALQCSMNRGETQRAWPVVLSMLQSARTDVKPTVHVFTDLQATEWRDVVTDSNRRELSEIANQADLSFVDVTSGLIPNPGLSDVRIDNAFVTLDTPATLRVTLQNASGSELRDREVRMLVDDRVVRSERVSVKPFTRLTIPFRHQFRDRGRFRVTLEIDSDRLMDDNTVNHVVQVYDEVPVLLVNGKPSARHMGRATDFLRLALDPGSDIGWNTPYDVRVVSEAELSSVRIENYTAVFLCNVRQLTTSEAARLRDFVYSGGAVTICPGDLTDLQNYNARLFSADGLMPEVRFEKWMGNAEQPNDVFELDANRIDHPLMSVYQGNPGHGLEQVLTFKYAKVNVNDTSSVRVALRFTNDDPVILESRHGAGSVCLTTIAGDDSKWSTWNTASGTYVTLMNEIARFTIGQGQNIDEAIVGRPWRRSIGESDDDATAIVNDSRRLQCSIERSASGNTVVVEDIPEPGFCSVTVNADDYLIPANVDPEESDLRSVPQDVLRTEFLGESTFRYSTGTTFALASSQAEQGRGDTFAFLLFAMVATILGAELLLASRVGPTAWIVFLMVTATIFVSCIFLSL